MKKERILLIGGNYAPEPTGIGKYTGEMMAWLNEIGYECGVITTYPYYPFWKVQPPYKNKSFWFSKERISSTGSVLTIYRCPHYVPLLPSGKKRIISDLSFFLSAFIQILILIFKKKYDIVIAVAPPFQLGLLAHFYKKLKGAKFAYHIQDLQIDAAKELKMINSKWMLNIMFKIERVIMQKADHLSSISEGMIRNIKSKCNKLIHFFPNWVDEKKYYPLSIKDQSKSKFNFHSTDKIVLYSGAIGEKQGLDAILQTAQRICRPEVKFVICGTGPYKEILRKKMHKMGLKNVIFLPLQSKDSFNEFLNMADVHLVLQKANANDLVMPSKLTTILAVGGKAVVSAQVDSSLYSFVSKNNLAILVEPENQSALLDAINNALDNLDSTIGNNARKYVESHLTIDNVIQGYLEQIISVKKSTTSVLKLRSKMTKMNEAQQM